MTQQTFTFEANDYVYSSTSHFKGWLPDEQPTVIAGLRDRVSQDLTLRSIYLYGDDGEFLVNVTGGDLSDTWETNGAARVTVGDESLTVKIDGADSSDGYHWLPENSDEVLAFWRDLPAVYDSQAGTVTLTDGTGESPLSAPTIFVESPDANDFSTEFRLEETELVVTLTDGNYDRVEYLWTVSGGTLDDPTSATPIWTRPLEAVTITLTVTVYGDGFKAPNSGIPIIQETEGKVQYHGPAPYGIRPSGEALLQIELEDGTALRYSHDLSLIHISEPTRPY